MKKAPLIVPGELDDAGLDPYVFRALCHVARRAGEPGGEFRGGRTGAARACRMSLSQWKRSLRQLLDLGVLEVIEARFGRATRYRYTGHPVLTEPGSDRTGSPQDRTRFSQNRDPVLTEPLPGPDRAIEGIPEGAPSKETQEGLSDSFGIGRPQAAEAHPVTVGLEELERRGVVKLPRPARELDLPGEGPPLTMDILQRVARADGVLQ